MAEEIGIAVTMTDKASATFKSLAGSSRAFDKSMEDLEKRLKSYEKVRDRLVKKETEQRQRLAEINEKVRDAQKNYRRLRDEASRGVLEGAINEQVRRKNELKVIEIAIKNNQAYLDQMYKQARGTAGMAGRAVNRAGGDAGGITGLIKAGVVQKLGDSVGQLANTLLSSAIGEPDARLTSSALSGIISGGTMGAMAGLPGIIIGGLVGGVSGLLSGKSEIYQAEDEAFKAYYQELYEAGEAKSAASLEAGTATASQRELDAIAFNRLLGEGTGDKYLSDLRQLAASTPMEYGDLTQMSRALAVGFGDSSERMLSLMQSIGDAGSAVGVTAQDMSMMAQAMSRMQSSGKATLEYLNILQERGVNVIGMLADEYGKTQGEIYSLISKGEINGQSAVDIIERGMAEAYGGAMETMAQTYSGLSSTLSDTMTEIDNARGEGYTGGRKEGLAAEIDAYGGALGDAMESLYRIRGENEAYLESLEEQYKREALSAVLTGGETTLFEGEQKEDLDALRGDYVRASREYLEGNKDAGLKMENLAQLAESLATEAYQSSEQYKLVQQTELDQIAALRENTAALDGWRNAYNMQQAFTKGLAAVVSLKETSFADTGMYESASWGMHEYGRDSRTKSDFQSGAGERAAGFQRSAHAYGLRRVPYDGYAAILHQGERVLTAREARAQDSAPAGAVSVNISGQWSVRSNSDIDSIASALVQRIELAQRAGVRG